MKQSILKEQEFEWIDFHSFIEEIKTIVPKERWTQPDMPWSGIFHGHIFTHEHNGLFLIGNECIRFNEDEALCFLADNTPFTIRHPISPFIK